MDKHRPLWQRALINMPWVLIIGFLASTISYQQGKAEGFHQGADAMKVAIFGALDRITRDTRP